MIHKNIIKNYLQAITYDYECNSIYHHLYDIKSPIKFIPKVHYYRNIIFKFKKLINLLFPILIFIYLIVFYFPLTFFNFFNSFKFLKNSKNKVLSGSAYLDMSESKYFSFISSKTENYPRYFLNFNKHSRSKSELLDIEDIYLEDVINIKILIIALFYSIISPFHIFFSKKRNLLLFSYTSFYWFVIFFVLKHSKINSIWLSNHYDRWTVLSSALNIPVTLIQHGKMSHYDKSSNKEYFHNFSFKLENISTIYSLNKESNYYFKRYVKGSNLTFKKIDIKLDVLKWKPSSKQRLKLLIIGNKILERFHFKIIKFLKNKFNNKIDIAYKYHPLQKNQLNIKNLWHINKKNSIPDSELVITYGSSIDDEISKFLSVVFFHYDDNDLKNLDSLLITLSKKINEMCK